MRCALLCVHVIPPPCGWILYSNRGGRFPPRIVMDEDCFFLGQFTIITAEVNFAVHATGDVRADARQQCKFFVHWIFDRIKQSWIQLQQNRDDEEALDHAGVCSFFRSFASSETAMLLR